MKLKLSTAMSRVVLAELSKVLPEGYRQAMRDLWSAPLGVSLELSAIKAKQTDEQRGYFHLCCRLVGEHLGYTPDEIKNITKRAAFGAEVHHGPLGDVERVKSSALANRDEYSVLIQTLHRLAAEQGYSCPEPERKVV